MYKQYRKPLTKNDLKTIKARRGNDLEVSTLLWEIARLRELIYSANLMIDFEGSDSNNKLTRAAWSIRTELKKRLEYEPVVGL